MTRTHVLRIGGWLLLAAPLVVTATPPEPPPPLEYRLSGRVVDAGGQPVRDVTVTLAANCSEDGSFELLRTSAGNRECTRSDDGTPVALTDAGGRFSLVVVTHAELDTIAAAVVLPDGFQLGTRRAATSVREYPVEESRPYEEESFMCATSVGYRMVVVGYQRTYAPDTLVVE